MHCVKQTVKQDAGNLIARSCGGARELTSRRSPETKHPHPQLGLKYPYNWLVSITIAGLFVLLCVINYVMIFEDAFISFRYALNFAEGKGLVFNAGEKVWGYSNFLWVVILSLFSIAGFSIPLISKIIGVVSGVLITVALFFWMQRTDQKHVGNLLKITPALLFATNIHVLYAAQNGLETMLYTAVVFLGILFLIHAVQTESSFPVYSIFFLAASLLRPEAPLFMVIAIGIETFMWVFGKRSNLTRTRLLKAVIIYSAGMGIFSISMFFYYGYILPNSYYMKVHFKSFDRMIAGIGYVHTYLVESGGYFCIFLMLFSFHRGVFRTQNIILAIFLLSYTSFIILVGGDFAVYFSRFIVPVIPIIYLLTTYGIINLLNYFRHKWTKLVPIFLCIAILMINVVGVRNPLAYFFSETADRKSIILENVAHFTSDPSVFRDSVKRWFTDFSFDITPMGMVGQILSNYIDQSATIATCQSGQIPYYLKDVAFMDLCGLMDDRIAHSGGLTLDYLKERSCDYFIEVYSEITRRDYYIPGTIFPHIIFSSYFQSHYELAHVFAIENSWKERSFSYTFYMLLFKKRNKPIELPAIDYNLKKQVYDVQKRGQLTEIIGIFDLPDRKQTVLSADTVRYQNQEIVIHEEPLQQLWTFAEKDEVLLQIDADTSFDRYDGWGYLKVQQAGHLRRIRFKLEALSTTGMILRSNSSVVQSFLSFRPDQFLPVKVELPIVGLSDIAYIRLSVECDMPIPELQIRDLMIFGWPKRLNHREF